MNKETIAKNIAIAEMLGAIQEQWYPPNKDTGNTGVHLSFPISMYEYTDSDGKKCQYKWYPDNKRFHPDSLLKFHSDSNWQEQALLFVENMNFSIDISSLAYAKGYGKGAVRNYCWFTEYLEDTKGISIGHNGSEKEDRRTVVFEALYQFSQYLKK